MRFFKKCLVFSSLVGFGFLGGYAYHLKHKSNVKLLQEQVASCEDMIGIVRDDCNSAIAQEILEVKTQCSNIVGVMIDNCTCNWAAIKKTLEQD